MLRAFHMSAAQGGLTLGFLMAAAAATGAIAGGVIADKLRRKGPVGRSR